MAEAASLTTKKETGTSDPNSNVHINPAKPTQEDSIARVPLKHPALAHRANSALQAQTARQIQRQVGNRAAQRIVLNCKCACGGSCEQCQSRRLEEYQGTVQREPSANPPTALYSIPDGAGHPLDAGVRGPLESHYRTDLSDVRVHTDTQAAQSANDFNALAYTAGRDMYFASGMYAPSSAAGQKLLAHEVAHVVQQSSGKEPSIAAKTSHGVQIGAVDDPLEAEAERASQEFMSVEHPSDLVRSPGQRQIVASPPGVGPRGVSGWLRRQVAAPEEDAPKPGSGAYTAYIHVSMVKSDSMTHWTSEAERRQTIADYLRYARGRPDLKNLYDEAAAAFPDIAATGPSGGGSQPVPLAVTSLQGPAKTPAPAPVAGQVSPNAPQVSRPAGLPTAGGYTLQPALGVPPSLADQIPEGQLTTVTAEMLRAALSPTPQPATRPADGNAVPAAASGGYAGLESNVLRYGVAAPAGDYAIGIASFPRWTPGRVPSGLSGLIPEHPVIWGHTAVYVRGANGVILRVVSYAPSSLLNAGLDIGTTPAPGLAPGTAPSVVEGTGSTPATFYNDRLLLLNSKVRTVEFGVPQEVAEAFLGGLPSGQTYGLANPSGTAQYSARPAQTYGLGVEPGTCPNCIGWAVPKVEGALGGRITSQGIPVTDLPAATGQGPVPYEANQGQLMRALAEGQQIPGSLQVVGPKGEPLPLPTSVGGLSPGMQVLKWGGRIMLVYAVYSTYAEIRDAPKAERGRTAAGAISGFAGGLALGATSGLVCGPGAPVCSVVLGLAFGFVGYAAARDVGELSYEKATGTNQPLYTTKLWNALNAPVVHDYDIPRNVCPGQPTCHTPSRYLSPDWRQQDSLRARLGLSTFELSPADIGRLMDFAGAGKARDPGASGQK